MNLSDVNKLKAGDSVVFNGSLPCFTVGKKYPVRNTEIGIFIYDDKRLGYPLADVLHLEHYFGKLP